MDKVSISYLVSFPKYKTKCVIKFLLTVDDVINFKIYLGSTSKAMVEREKKSGRQKYKNLKISKTKRAI